VGIVKDCRRGTYTGVIRVSGSAYALLSDGEKSVQELAQGFDITVAAISQHLAVLLDSRLVSRRALGRQRLYRLDAAPLRIVDEWTSQHRSFWQSRLKRLQAYLDKSR